MSELTEKQKEERIKKYKALGIPIPMEPVAMPTNMNANPDKLKMLEQIKRGALKQQFDEVLNADSPNDKFKPIGAPVKKNQSAPVQKKVMAESNSEADMIEKMLYGETSSTPTYMPPIQHSAQQGHVELNVEGYGQNVPTNENKLMMLKQKMEALKSGKTFTPPIQNTHSNPNVQISTEAHHPNLYIGQPAAPQMSEEEFTKKVTKIAVEVSKKIIKNIIVEYVKQGKDIIVESSKIKKAEIVDKNKVKIEGKVYKLVPDSE